MASKRLFIHTWEPLGTKALKLSIILSVQFCVNCDARRATEMSKDVDFGGAP